MANTKTPKIDTRAILIGRCIRDAHLDMGDGRVFIRYGGQWECYRREDGIEMFKGYAHGDNAIVLNSIVVEYEKAFSKLNGWVISAEQARQLARS